MRLLPSLSAFLLIAGTAAAQPAPDQMPPPSDQMAPNQMQSGQMQPGQMPPGQMQPRQMPPGQHMGMKARFEAANTTNDGKLTLDQAQAARMGMIVHNFDQIDTERKGYVTLQDIKMWHHARQQARTAQPSGAPQPQ